MDKSFFLDKHQKILDMNKQFEMGKHGQLSKRSFHEVGFLGKGAFGIVKKVKSRKTGKIYALKLLQKQSLIEENMVEQFMKEGRSQPAKGSNLS